MVRSLAALEPFNSGPDSDKPGGAVAGLSALELMQAWLKPFNPEADGGRLCFF